MKLLTTLLFVATGAAGMAQPAFASAREEARLIEASGVLEELRAQRDTAIPDRLMARAYGIAVIPNVVKIAAVVGGRRGSGALVVRDANGRFSNPIMVSITGGNVGWQIGVQSTDIVLVFTTRKSIEGITDGKLTLGGDASVAAGPVGRAASAATDQSSPPRSVRTRAIAGCLPVVHRRQRDAIDAVEHQALRQECAGHGHHRRAHHLRRRLVKQFQRAILTSTAAAQPAAAPPSAATTTPDSAAAPLPKAPRRPRAHRSRRPRRSRTAALSLLAKYLKTQRRRKRPPLFDT